jgi:uracil-DNA glycosylase
VVGQDWGDVSYFRRWEGRDQPSGNPTNENLQRLLKKVGVRVAKPRDQQDQVVFFTNLILCLKTGGLQGRVDEEWFTNCACTFTKPLIDIINPRAVLGLGKKVSECILSLYGIPYKKNDVFSRMINLSPYRLTKSTVLFPLYHCGAGGVNRNRPMPEQEKDWSKVNKWLRKNDCR